jgi:hypothetical protein
MDALWDAREVTQQLSCTVAGTKETVRKTLQKSHMIYENEHTK